MAIQLVPSAWLMKPPVGSGCAAVEDADVVQAEKAALEDVAALRVLAVDPPGEIQHQLVEDAFEERQVAACRRACCLRSIWNTRQAAQAWTGGFTSPNAHS